MNVKEFYRQAYVWLLSFGPRLLVSIVLLLVGFWLIRTLSKTLNNTLTRRNVDPSLRPFLIGTLGLASQVLLILACMQVIGIELTIFAALIGAFGVAAGLALSGTLQNFTSGILILLLKPFEVNDIIIAQGQEGVVTYIKIFYTVVRTIDNKTVIIPNSKLSNEVITNLSREGHRRLDIELKFSFGIPFEQVKSILSNAINEHKGLLKDPTFQVGVSAIDPDGYKVMTNVWVNAYGFQDVKMDLQEIFVKDVLAAGIKLPGVV